MDKKYFIPIVLLFGLGLVLVLLPKKKTYDEMPPAELLRQLTSSSRFVSPDVIADRLINKDPSQVLIDVRDSSAYAKFSLPGATNIPLKDILSEETQYLLAQEGLDFIFFSNGDITSDQAWILCKRKGLNNIFVMKGGLNAWFDHFFLLQPPPETASGEEIAIYQFRLGVKQFLTGGETEIKPVEVAEKIVVKPRAKKSVVEGGC